MVKAVFSFIFAVLNFLTFFGAEEIPPVDNGVIDVCFDALNGSEIVSLTAEKNSLLTEPAVPERDKFIFGGWYKGNEKWNFETDTVSEDMTLTAKWSKSKNFFDNKADAHIKTAGSNIRIMSFNILSCNWNNQPPVEGRDAQLLDVVSRYAPDVIGMQEVDSTWYESLGNNFGTYRFANEGKNTIWGSLNFSTIAYNTETVSLIKFHQKHYIVRESDECRNVMWALFEEKATGNRFIVTSTHWDLKSELRVKEALELAGIVSLLEELYDVPVFATGDYNANEDTDEYDAFMNVSGFKSGKYAAEKKGLLCSTYHLGNGTGSSDDYSSGYWALGIPSFRNQINTVKSIDHIFASNDAQILYYDTIVDEAALNASDHCPIYIDVAL